MATMRAIQAILGIDKEDVPQVLLRAWAMYGGLGSDPETYASPIVPLPAFLSLIENVELAQQRVPSRAVGLAAERDVQRDLLVSGMKRELSFVQALADADRLRAVSLIVNAGLLVAAPTVYAKAPLTLKLGTPPGTVLCYANVGLLVRAGGHRPRGERVIQWDYTVNGGETFVSAPSTPGGKTVLQDLPLLTRVGVRVRISDSTGIGAWSQIVTIMVL